MEHLGGRGVRRRKSHFHPWKSFIGKKQTADAAAYAEQRKADVPAIRKLTVGLIDTYEAINAAYYEKKQRAAAVAEAAQVVVEQEVTQQLAQTSITATTTNAPAPANTTAPSDEEKKNTATGSLYCDENYDYKVRTGDLFHNRYLLEKVIGRGSFGQVVRAYDSVEGQHVAIKIIKNNARYVEQALSEVRMTAYLNRIDPRDEHAIMRLRDKFIFRGHQCLVLELLSFSLYDLIRSTDFFGVSLNLVRKFARQILSCLSFLARPDINVAHCDLKPENVLLRHPQRSAIKVVDFGASCRVSDAMFTYVQSRFYRAPEVILGIPYDTQVDVWSLGCMLVELHTGYPLFAGRDEGDQISIIVERIGLPPKHMLDKGKKTEMFFDRDEHGDYRLKYGLTKKETMVIPKSKPVKLFVEELTGNGSGKRKRSSDGHSDSDYNVFLTLTDLMLQYDPNVRITAEEALRNPFFTGVIANHATIVAKRERSGRDSPPCLPELDAAVTESVAELHPGRKAPVQRKAAPNRGVHFDIENTHSSMSNHGMESVRRDEEDMIGGPIRISKSETAIEQQAIDPIINVALHASTWAEEVGIEPPPWRAMEIGGLSCRRPLLAAGGGERRRKRCENVVPLVRCLRTSCVFYLPPMVCGRGGCDERLKRRTSAAVAVTPATKHAPFPMGTTGVAVAAAENDLLARRLAALTRARPPPLRVAGHGDALLLERDRADERRLTLSNAQPEAAVASLYF